MIGDESASTANKITASPKAAATTASAAAPIATAVAKSRNFSNYIAIICNHMILTK